MEGYLVFVFAVLLLSKESMACFQTDSITDVFLKPGETFYKECECYEPGYDVHDLQWVANGEVVTGSGPNINQDIDGNRLNIYITINSGMSGTYRCQTMFNGMIHAQTYVITVYDEIQFVNSNATQYLEEGTNSMINCEVLQDYDTMITWYKGAENTRLDFTGDKYEKIKNGLIVKNVTKDDQGLYRCLVFITQFGDEKSLDIDVKVMTKPVVTDIYALPAENVTVGEILSITCMATGFPSPQYKWMKHSETGELLEVTMKQNTENVLVFERIKVEDRGTYKCVTSNAIGESSKEITIEVIAPPSIVSFRNITVHEGSTAVIFCNVTGNPEPDVTITYEGKKLGQNDANTLYEEVITNNVTITMDRRHDGIYICNASNIVDFDTEIMYVKVLHRPYFEVKQEVVWGWPGSSVNLSCLHESAPPAKVTWRYTQTPSAVLGDFKYNDLLNEMDNTMTHTILVDDHFAPYGTYNCIAENEFGNDMKTIIFKRGYAPSAVHNVTLNEVTATSALFSLDSPTDYIGPGIQGFTAQYDEQSNYEITNIHKNRTWAWNRPFRLEKLKPNNTYFVKFAAVNSVGPGVWTENLMFVTMEKSVPELPIFSENPLVASPTGHTLKWKAPESNGDPIDYYALRYCPVHEELDELLCKERRVEATTTELELQNLEYNTTYYLELVAHNSEGNSTSSNITLLVPEAKIVDPPLLSAGVLLAISAIVVIVCLLLLDVLLFFWKQQGIIATCCSKKNKKQKTDSINRRDKKGLLKSKETEDALTRPDNGHKEYEYNKTTGIITGKHSAV